MNPNFEIYLKLLHNSAKIFKLILIIFNEQTVACIDGGRCSSFILVYLYLKCSNVQMFKC